MFDLDLTSEQEAVADLARDLGLSRLAPAARIAEKAAAIPADVRAALFEAGLTTPIPEAFGGGGIPDAVTQMIAIEGLAYGDPGITMAAVWDGAAASLIGLCGTAEQQQAHLPRLAVEADHPSGVALYEGFGRSPSEFTTTIGVDANGSWRVVGTKVAVAGGRNADPLIVVGVDPVDGRLRAAIMKGSMVTFSAADRHLALDAAPISSIDIDVAIPESDLLGGAACPLGALERAVGRLRLAVAAAQIGTAHRAVDYASHYATERIAFGKPIAAFQGVSFLLAEAITRISAARLEVRESAGGIDDPQTSAPAIENAVSCAVNYAGKVATESTRDSLQVLGGHGFITDHPVELWYRSSSALSALDFDPLLSSFEPAF